MVDSAYISKVVRALEHYFIYKNGFSFDGSTYELILFTPSHRGEVHSKYELYLSAAEFDKYPRKEITTDIFYWLKDVLDAEEFQKIRSIVVPYSTWPIVKKLNFLMPTRDGIREIDNVLVGDFLIDYGILVYSNLLKKLKSGSAITAKLKDRRVINMGIDKIDKNMNISFYTGKGLRELFHTKKSGKEKKKLEEIKAKGEDYLIKNHYYDVINLNDIVDIN